MRLLIIIPAYNEAENLKKVIDHLNHICPKYDYMIVNDGSTDATKKLCETNQYPVIHHPVNQGLTGAVRTGMRYALEHGYDMALQFDADGQHLPEYIEAMVACMEAENCDIVIASRFYGTKMPFHIRPLGQRMIAAAIRLTTGTALSDPTSGMRLYNKAMMQRMVHNTKLAPEPDTIAYLLRMGAKVQEIKAEMQERTRGQSYLTPWNAIKYMIKVLSHILIFQWFWEREPVSKEIVITMSDEIDRTA